MQISFIGLGDVGSRFSAGVSAGGKACVVGYDLKLGQADFSEKEERCRAAGVRLAESPAQAVAGSDIIIAATSCAEAIDTAKMYLPYLHSGQSYLDINSAVPEIKQTLAELVKDSGAAFADGGIMGSPLNGGHRVEVVLSGPAARSVSAALNDCGMNTRFISDTVGRASSLKILRSIFTKGLEALLLESYSAAFAYGVLDEVKGSILHILTKEDLDVMFGRMLRTDVVHAKRRALEVGAVAEMLQEAGMDATMSEAACKKLLWSEQSGAKEHFAGKTPEAYLPVVEYFSALRREESEQ